jgi:hypothetical protein
MADNLLSFNRRTNNNLKSYSSRRLARGKEYGRACFYNGGRRDSSCIAGSEHKQGGRNIQMDNKLDMQNQQKLKNGNARLRRLGIVAAGIGLGSVLAYLLSRVLGNTERVPDFLTEHIVDDRGTDQRKAAKILLNLRDRGFEASDEKLSLALGRPVEEVAGWTTGQEIIDDDVVMKARGIAMHRGIHVE